MRPCTRVLSEKFFWNAKKLKTNAGSLNFFLIVERKTGEHECNAISQRA